MDTLYNLAYGFSVAFEWSNLMWSLFGVFMGNLIGVLPGMGVMAAISILLPLTYSMTPVEALMMLAGIFYGAMYGGGITSILLNLPGTASHAVVCLDGSPMARQGKAGSALFMLVIASFIGAVVGILSMVLFTPALVKVAFKFGAAEYFSMMLLGLLAGATLSKGSALKGVAMTVLGLILGVVGTDVNTGIIRFTFGLLEITDGLSLVALAMGLFGVADFLAHVNNRQKAQLVKGSTSISMRMVRPEAGDMRRSVGSVVRGSGVGAILGVLPGTGSTIASFISYAIEKKVSKTPERFGRGAIEGVAGPESSNNAAAQTSFIPTLSLGIPGDPVMALMLGALMIHGIQPGPQLITEHPDIFWGLIASFWIGNVVLVLLNLPFIGIWARFLSMPYKYLYPVALFFVSVGVYSTNSSLFDVGAVLVFGMAGYVFAKLKLEAAPLLLGFVLGPMLEENFRRAVLMSRGDMAVFVETPISAGFIVACAALILWQLFAAYRARQVRARTLASAV
jgi:TctA family transporter